MLLFLGLYSLIEPYSFPYAPLILTWQTLFLLGGMIWIIAGIREGKKGGSLFPGILLIGYGAQHLLVRTVHGWPSAWYMIAFWFGLAFLLSYANSKNRKELLFGLLFIGIAAYNYYPVHQGLTFLLSKWWPLIAIAVGAFLLLRGSRGKRR